MADFDPALALRARGFDPQSYLAPIQGSALSAQADLLGQQAQGSALSNIKAGKTLSALDSYGKTDPNSPAALHALSQGGPELVGQGALSQSNIADTQRRVQEVHAAQMEQRGQIASGYLASGRSDAAWADAVRRAKEYGIIQPLDEAAALTWPQNRRDAIAQSWAGAGSRSAQTSGIEQNNSAAATARYGVWQVAPGYGVRTGPGFPSLGASPNDVGPSPAPPARQGRSAAIDGTPAMAQAEQANGLPAGYLSRTAQIESGGRADAQNKSGAAGMFQFMPGTWAKYGSGSPFDPAASTDAAARLAADNQQFLTKRLGRQPTAGELYLAHQQGMAGAASLLTNPSARAADVVGAKAVIANGGSPHMTAGQFASMWVNKFNGAPAGNFNISGPSPTGSGAAMPSSLGASPYGALPSPDSFTAMPRATNEEPSPTALGGGQPATPLMEGRSAATAPVPPTQPLSQPRGLQTLDPGLSLYDAEKQRLDAARAVGEESTARDQFVSASQAQQGLLQLQGDLSKLVPGKGAGVLDTLLAPGSGADRRIGFAKAVNSTLAASGIPPIFDPDKISAAESSQKITGRLGFDLAGGLGKGEAGYIVNQAIGLNPSIMSTPKGAKILIGSLMATQQRQKDFAAFQRQYAMANSGNPIGAEQAFDEKMPPTAYVAEAHQIARVPQQMVEVLQRGYRTPGMREAFDNQYGPGLSRYFIGGTAR